MKLREHLRGQPGCRASQRKGHQTRDGQGVWGEPQKLHRPEGRGGTAGLAKQDGEHRGVGEGPFSEDGPSGARDTAGREAMFVKGRRYALARRHSPQSLITPRL